MATYCGLFLCVLAVGIECTPFDEQKLEIISKTCRAETGMDKEALDKALKEERLPPPTEVYLQFLECSYRKQGYLDGENRIVFDAIKTMLINDYSEAVLDEILESCKEQGQINTPGKRAYKAAGCIIDGLHSHENNLESNIL